jgi:hypothetical protein
MAPKDLIPGFQDFFVLSLCLIGFGAVSKLFVISTIDLHVLLPISHKMLLCSTAKRANKND